MSVTMDKELLVRIPSSLYAKVKKICASEYKSMSAMIRELFLEKVEENLGEKEMRLLEKQSKGFHKGKGTDWRKVKRG